MWQYKIILLFGFWVFISGCSQDMNSQGNKKELYKIYSKGTVTLLLNTHTGQTWSLYDKKGHIKSWDYVYFEKNTDVTTPSKALKIQKIADDIIKKTFNDSSNKQNKPITK